MPSCLLGQLDQDIDSITGVSLRPIPHAELRVLRDRDPELLEGLWRVTLLDAALQRCWIFRVGRSMGRARIANLFGGMLLRQFARGLCTTEQFDLPITQIDLAEACGMTAVHANRMVGDLREEGICTFGNGVVAVTGLPGLFRTGQCAWDYLSLPAEVKTTLKERLLPRIGHGAVPRLAGSHAR